MFFEILDFNCNLKSFAQYQMEIIRVVKSKKMHRHVAQIRERNCGGYNCLNMTTWHSRKTK
jgi:hypothetical protein